MVAVSRQNRENVAMALGVPAEGVRLIHNGSSLLTLVTPTEPTFRGELKLPAGAKVVTTVARLHRDKGYRDLLDVVPLVVEQAPAARFVWVGEGPLRSELVESIEAKNLGSVVHLLGYRADIPRVLAESTIFVLPTYYEGFSFALLEAMQAGVPIVAGDAPGVEELVMNGETGLLCKPGDTLHLSRAILRLLRDADLRERLSRAAQAHASRFTGARMLEETLEALDYLATAKHRTKRPLQGE